MRVAAVLAFVALLAADDASAQARQPLPKWEDPIGPPTAPDVWLKRMVGRYRFEGLVEVVYEDEYYNKHRCAPLPPDPEEQDDPPPPAVPYCSDIKGKGDCVAIGTGPGVQCILNVTWQDMNDLVYPPDDPVGAYNLPGGVSFLDPAMLLFGLDPGKSGINYLVVDNKGLPEGGLGLVTGNRATFRTPCVNTPILLNAMKPPLPNERRPERSRSWQKCERVIRIDAKPDANLLHLSMDIELNGEPFTRMEMSLNRVPQTDEGPTLLKPSGSR